MDNLKELYKNIDDNVYEICHHYGFDVQTRIGNNNTYHACFIANGKEDKIQEALTVIENLGFKRVEIGEVLGKYLHYYTLDLNKKSNHYMNQEDKELLLKDLSSRLPYGVIYHRNDGANIKLKEIDVEHSRLNYTDDIEKRECKPYLRPMSSMTEEEWKELNCICYIVPLYDGCFGVDMRAYCKNGQPHYRKFSEFSTIEDWLNAHHFDYRIIYDEDKKKYMSMIEKGLAIEVNEENNPY